MFRMLEIIPPDHDFVIRGKVETCHATGYEVFSFGAWWVEYVDSHNNTHFLKK